jgi:hypothetical protein
MAALVCWAVGARWELRVRGRQTEPHQHATCRRAKRLRRILRQLDSPVARAPLLRFWRGTWAVVAVLALAHIVCYSVLSMQVLDRHT